MKCNRYSYVPNLFHVSATGKSSLPKRWLFKKTLAMCTMVVPPKTMRQLYLPANFPQALFEISRFLFLLFSVKMKKKQQKVKARQRITAYNRKKGYLGFSTAGPHKPLHANDRRLLCIAGCNRWFRALFHYFYKCSTATSFVFNGCKIYNA